MGGWTPAREAISSGLSHEGGGQAPYGEPISMAFASDGFAFAVVKLPGDCAAFVPAGAFGPHQEDFAAVVADGDWMLGLRVRRDCR